jgi:hypothetical protein
MRVADEACEEFLSGKHRVRATALNYRRQVSSEV